MVLTIDQLCILAAFLADNITEGEAADIIGVDRATLRLMKTGVLQRAAAIRQSHWHHGIGWGDVRKGRPPKADTEQQRQNLRDWE